MNKENSENLIKIFPSLFQKDEDGTSCGFLGFECGDGWFDLLKECILKIKEEIEQNTEKYPPELPVYVTQVKEKYGSLRFYVSYETDEIDKIIREACVMSSCTCESCGKPGDLHKVGGWFVTICLHCLM